MDRQTTETVIDDYLSGQMQTIGRQVDHETWRLMKLSAGRVLTNSAVKLGSVSLAVLDASLDDTRHILDWLSSAVFNEEPWIRRTDASGRPLKLMKFGSYDQIVTEADKAMRKRLNAGTPTVPETGVTVVHEYADGWTVVRLKTPESLDREGHAMGHCVGMGSYDSGMRSNFTGIYSLRDPHGKSHVTVEVDNVNDTVKQIKGRQNRAPKPEYMRRLLSWPKIGNLNVDDMELPPGFAIDRKTGIRELADLKPGDILDCDLAIVLQDNNDYRLVIPEGVTINGNVVVQGHKGGTLKPDGDDVRMIWPRVIIPDNIVFRGDLCLDHVSLQDLAFTGSRLRIRNAIVDGIHKISCRVLKIAATEFTDRSFRNAILECPVEMQACRGAVFSTSTSLQSLMIAGCSGRNGDPAVRFESGTVTGDLYILNSSVAFGRNFRADGGLDIKGCDVETMPSELRVSNSLSVVDTSIDMWPERLDVGGTLIDEHVTARRSEPTAVCGVQR